METASSQEKTYYPKKIIDEYCLKMSSFNPDKGSPNFKDFSKLISSPF